MANKKTSENYNSKGLTMSVNLTKPLQLINLLSERSELDNESLFISVSPILGGLLISNELTLRNVKVTVNGAFGLTRIYLGDCNTIPYPNRDVSDDLPYYDYTDEDLTKAVDFTLAHLINEDESIIKGFIKKNKKD